jgi:hypothetical protein
MESGPMRGEIGIRPHESGMRPMRGGIRLHLRQALNVLLREQATITSHHLDSLFTLVFSLSLSPPIMDIKLHFRKKPHPFSFRFCMLYNFNVVFEPLIKAQVETTTLVMQSIAS